MFLFICNIIVPLLFVIYNVVYYFKKKVIYTLKNDDFIIINDDFYKIQLIVSCVNAISVSILLFAWQKYSFSFGLFLFLAVFWSFNYLIKVIAAWKDTIR